MAAVLWVILILSIVTVANRIHYTYLELNNKPIPTGSNPISPDLLARVLLARRAHDAAVRSLGDRDSRVHLAHAARVAARSAGDDARPLELAAVTPTRPRCNASSESSKHSVRSSP
jgi:hypothetical protein